MHVTANKTRFENIRSYRDLYLQETHFQLRYHACHERGWSDSYLFQIDNIGIGYGAIKGKDGLKDRDTVFELYVIPPYRHLLAAAFKALLQSSGARYMESQSNDLVATSLLYQHCRNICSDTILFKDRMTTSLAQPDVEFRKRQKADIIFTHQHEEPGDYVLAYRDKVLATGGFTLHYNFPFADLYMEVEENHRGKGYGSYLVQELKKQCYRQGRVPGARCAIDNLASKATLVKAGFEVAAFMYTGQLIR